MDSHLVFDAADLDRVVLLDQEHRKAARVRRILLAARENQRDIGEPVGDEALDAVEVPLTCGLVKRGLGRDGAQVGAGIGLSQDHGARNLAARELRQDPSLGLGIAVLLEAGGDLLETVDGHQAALGPGHDLDHHRVHGLRQVQAAEFAWQHRSEELGLLEGVDRVERGRGIRDLAVGEVSAFLVRFAGARSDAGCRHVAQDF